MAGTSDRALKTQYAENKFRGNGGVELQNKEFSDGSGLEAYDANFRMYDPQIGRFWQQDPLTDADESWSPYSFVHDNPVSFSDPLGLADSTAPTSILSTPKKPKELAPVIVSAKKKDCQTCSGPSVTGGPAPAGVHALPLNNPLRPIGPPAKIIPYEGPAIEIGTLGEATSAGLSIWGVLGRAGGTLTLTLWPVSAPGEGLHWQPYSGHGNNKNNDNPHIVYMFFFTPPPGDPRTPVLKYGISDEFRFGLDRPESQKAYLKALFGPSADYIIVSRTSSRELALFIEDLLVKEHILQWKERPRAQDKP